MIKRIEVEPSQSTGKFEIIVHDRQTDRHQITFSYRYINYENMKITPLFY